MVRRAGGATIARAVLTCYFQQVVFVVMRGEIHVRLGISISRFSCGSRG
jgi:hypothetical protein